MWTKPASVMLQFIGFVVCLFGLLIAMVKSPAGIGIIIAVLGAMMIWKGGLESRRRIKHDES